MINSVTNQKAVASIIAAVWLALGSQGISYGQSPVEGGSIYWTDSREGIHRFSLDSKNVERLISPDLRRPGKIALDGLEGKIYWMDSHTIKWSDLDGENLEDLPFYPAPPDSLGFDIWEIIDPPDGMAGIARDITLELAEGKIYWTTLYSHGDYFTAAVLRSNLDGSNIEYVATATKPRGIALDVTGGKVYWIDHSGTIARADLYGATVESVLNGSNIEYILIGLDGHLADIALDVVGGKMYWTNQGNSTIQRADLDGSNVESVLTGLDGHLADIALDVVGGKMYWTSSTDLGKGAVQRANLDGSNVEHLLDIEWGRETSIALDLDRGRIYWTDMRGTIQRAGLDGSNIESLFAPVVRKPHGIALDITRGKMYWADMLKGAIQQSDLDGSNIEALVTGLDRPRGIALLGENRIYWADSGRIGKIQAANLDGTNVEDVVTGLNSPQDITLDERRGKIYWTLLGGHVIQRADLDGTNIEDVLTGLYSNQGIALDFLRNKIYWTEVDRVRCSNLDGTNVEDVVTDTDVEDLRVEGAWSDGYGAIALDLVRDKIYWVSLRRSPASVWEKTFRWEEIFRSNLDGSNIELIGGRGRNGIALDIPRPTSILTPDSLPEIPAISGLLPNYPNPFNASTQIAYRLATPGLVRLAIYNVLGQPVRTLVNQVHAAGSYQAPWDARDQQGDEVATGVYFTRLYYPGSVETRRLLYLK